MKLKINWTKCTRLEQTYYGYFATCCHVTLFKKGDIWYWSLHPHYGSPIFEDIAFPDVSRQKLSLTFAKSYIQQKLEDLYTMVLYTYIEQ